MHPNEFYDHVDVPEEVGQMSPVHGAVWRYVHNHWNGGPTRSKGEVIVSIAIDCDIDPPVIDEAIADLMMAGLMYEDGTALYTLVPG